MFTKVTVCFLSASLTFMIREQCSAPENTELVSGVFQSPCSMGGGAKKTQIEDDNVVRI